MSLDKAIEHGKEHRKPYGLESGTYSKKVSKPCRNHGGCNWCRDDRLHSRNVDEEAARQRMKDYCLEPGGSSG